VFTFDQAGKEKERIEAKRASLETGHWRLEQARVYVSGEPPRDHETYLVKTNLTAAQVRESFSTPETVPFWELPAYIEIAERSGLVAAGYKLQYQILIARPFLLTAMVLLACSVSLRFFRFGGVPRMVLSGVAAGFLLYVLSKVTEDLSKAELLHPALRRMVACACGGLTGFVVLLYQEDG
jgi:lipopolysaccharide export system permease protein